MPKSCNKNSFDILFGSWPVKKLFLISNRILDGILYKIIKEDFDVISNTDYKEVIAIPYMYITNIIYNNIKIIKTYISIKHFKF